MGPHWGRTVAAIDPPPEDGRPAPGGGRTTGFQGACVHLRRGDRAPGLELQLKADHNFLPPSNLTLCQMQGEVPVLINLAVVF